MDAWKQYKNVLAPHLSYDAWTDVSVEAEAVTAALGKSKGVPAREL
jgi:hypothetical protein